MTATLHIQSNALDKPALGILLAAGINYTWSNRYKNPLFGYQEQVAFIGQNPLEFSQTNSCTTLTPTSFCMVSLQFTPLSDGQKMASLVFLSNDPTQPMISVALSGTGVLPKYNLSATLKGNGGGFVKSSDSFC